MTSLLVAPLIFCAAVIYSSVGHAGASGYIAVMALFGTDPAVMKPTALCLNILVATLGAWRLHRAGWVSWPAVARFLAGSVPFAFLGGAAALPVPYYKAIVGIVLLASAARIFLDPRERAANPDGPPAPPPWLPAIAIGAGIGLLSGLTGTGGGIFLSPLLLLLGWAGARQAAGISAPFILVNSIAGLAGNWLSLAQVPPELPLYAAAALAGGLIGTQMALRLLSPAMLQRLLAAVLTLAGLKLLFA